MTNPSNPNGANQYLLDPRQKKCWEDYINPKSETFGNATQSAIGAGYEPDYADQITTVDWFKGKVRRLNMLGKAENVLDKTLDGEDIKLAQDTAKFIAKTLGKNEGYSERTELTGNDGKDLMPVDQDIKEKIGKAIKEILNDRGDNQE